MPKTITPAQLDALSARIEVIKLSRQNSGTTHRLNAMRETLLKLRRKFGLTYPEIEAELRLIGLDDVSLSEIKHYFRLIGAVKMRARKKRT